MQEVIAVNKKDQILGKADKKEAHQINGRLHRGFIVFIFNSKGELLLLKRSRKKLLWPLYWDGCCSHPKQGETYVQAGERRLKEELGFSCRLKYLGKFYYRAVYKNIGSENEICAVLSGTYDAKIKLNPEEIVEYRWLPMTELKKEIKEKTEVFAPWLKKSIRLIELSK